MKSSSCIIKRFFLLRKRALLSLASAAIFLTGCPETSEPTQAGSFVIDGLAQEDLWPQCPTLTPYPDTEGDFWLQFSPDALFCSELPAYSDIRQAFQEITEVRLMPGDLFLPLNPGDSNVPLSSCFASGENQVSPLGLAAWSVTRSETFGDDFVETVLKQPVRLEGHLRHLQEVPEGEELNPLGVLELKIAGPASQMQALSVGNVGDRPAPGYHLRLCADRDCSTREVSFGRCHREEGRVERFDIEFEQGRLSIVTVSDPEKNWFEGSILQTEGNLCGSDFSTGGYPQALSHVPYEFSVYHGLYLKLPEPIDGYCYLTVSSLSEWSNYSWVNLVPCDDENTTWPSWGGEMVYTLVDDGLQSDGGVALP
ncbi:MAG: hypothetical protein GY822_04010 [Deltaproteobacteria bacterium]|nr:hypothetical protein [Deltaproteobacteria bacterium]